MKKVIISGSGELQAAIAYGMSRLRFDVVVTDLNVDARERMVSKVRSLGGKIYNHTTSVYETGWLSAQLIISNKIYHANFCHSHNKKIRFAEIGGNIKNSQEIIDDVLKSKLHATIFRNLGLVPDWSERMKTIEGDAHWSKLQKVLGFPAAAAAACFALGHFEKNKKLVSYEDIPTLAYRRNLRVIEGRESIWRGMGYDE